MPKRFEVSKSVSNTAWGDVDKGRIWQVLKQALQEGATGAVQAVREVYAVVKAEINKDLTQADCWSPHHEVRDDGTVILNRSGLIAAAAALSGARSEPDLSPEQKAEARRHLLRHYRELEMPIPDSLSGEMSVLEARVTGEIKPGDIPLAPGVDLETLKTGDPDPMEVVVEIPAGRSTRGWNYRGESLQDIVNYVNQNTLSGFLGHQDPEKVEREFPTPVTHWVGALWRDGKAYFRGVVDKVAGDLKRWIRAGRVKQVSIFGIPRLQTAGGETEVVGYHPLSIDWTPLDRSGMPTRVVAVGEIDSTFSGGGQKAMTWKELVAQLKAMLTSKEVTLGQVAGEMGWKAREVAGELDAKWLQEVTGAVETLGKVREALGVTGEMDVVKAAQDGAAALKKVREALKVSGEMDVVKVAQDAARALEAQKAAEHDKAVGEMLAAKLTSEAVKKDISSPETQIGKLWAYHKTRIQPGATGEQIAGELDAFLGDKVVKAVIDAYHTDKPAIIGGTSEVKTTLRVKREQI